MILLAVEHLMRWITSGLFCGSVVAGCVWFLIRQKVEGRAAEARDIPADLRRIMAKRRGRRGYGAVLMILVALAFFVALNFLDPQTADVDPNAAVAIWAVVLLLLLVLVILALAEVREALTDRSVRDMEINDQLIRALTQHLANRGKTESTDGEKADEKNASKNGRGAGGNGRKH